MPLLSRPAELGTVAQQAMEDDGELAGDGDGGLLAADPLGQPGAPGLEGRPAGDPVQDDPGSLEQIGPQQPIPASRDVTGIVLLTRLEAPRRQPEIGADGGGMGESLRLIDDADLGERHDGPDPGRGHQPLHRLVLGPVNSKAADLSVLQRYEILGTWFQETRNARAVGGGQ